VLSGDSNVGTTSDSLPDGSFRLSRKNAQNYIPLAS
jgi:hypothetical protein